MSISPLNLNGQLNILEEKKPSFLENKLAILVIVLSRIWLTAQCLSKIRLSLHFEYNNFLIFKSYMVSGMQIT